MAFPYSYKKSIVFPRDKFNINIVTLPYVHKLITDAILNKNPINFEINDQTMFFTFKAPALNFKYSTELKINLTEEKLSVDFEVNFENLMRIILVGIILTAFFSFLSVKYFLIASGLISVLFFLIGYLTVDNFLEKVIRESFEGIINENVVEKLSDEQLSWIKDENRCSACGKELSEFDLQCSDCGIKLKRNRHTVPLDVSKYQDRNITYHIKK